MTPQNGTPNGVSAPARTDFPRNMPEVAKAHLSRYRVWLKDSPPEVQWIAAGSFFKPHPDFRDERDMTTKERLDLKTSVLEHGVTQPLLAYAEVRDGVQGFTTINGWTRLLIILQEYGGSHKVPVIVGPKPATIRELFALAMTTDKQAKFTFDDQLNAYEQVMAEDPEMTEEGAGIAIGVSQTVAHRLKTTLSNLPAEMRAALRGKTKFACELARLKPGPEQTRLFELVQAKQLELVGLNAEVSKAMGKKTKVKAMSIAIGRGFVLTVPLDTTPEKLAAIIKNLGTAVTELVKGGKAVTTLASYRWEAA